MELTSKERFQRMYEHREADRVPIMDSPWDETIDRWCEEGMPTRDYVDYFKLDKFVRVGTDNGPQLPHGIVEETDDYIIKKTSWGATVRNFKKRTTTPEHLGFSINTPDAWYKVKDRIQPTDDRIPWDMLKQNYKRWRDEGYWLIGGLWFGFDITHSHMVGTEDMLVAMFEEPEWVMDMFETELDVSIKLLERMWDAGYTFDEVHWYDDMGYKGTQFFSLKMYRELLKPYHQRAIDWAHQHGCYARLHSCGDINPFVPELIDMGLDGLNPLEVKAGMDPVALKQKYGDKLVFHGGTNVVNWPKRDVILEELDRVIPIMKQNGGYIFASDHSIPPQVSLEDFKCIIERVMELGKY